MGERDIREFLIGLEWGLIKRKLCCTWTGCNNLGDHTSNIILVDMMTISMLNYQADEYMEAVIARYYEYDT